MVKIVVCYPRLKNTVHSTRQEIKQVFTVSNIDFCKWNAALPKIPVQLIVM